MKSLTFESEIHFGKRRAGQRVIETGPEPVRPKGRLPRITRLMALAIRCERLIREGVQRQLKIPPATIRNPGLEDGIGV